MQCRQSPIAALMFSERLQQKGKKSLGHHPVVIAPDVDYKLTIIPKPNGCRFSGDLSGFSALASKS
jgi:hypothetical protein